MISAPQNQDLITNYVNPSYPCHPCAKQAANLPSFN